MRTFFAGLFALVSMVAILVAPTAMWLVERAVDPAGFRETVEPIAGEQTVRDYFAEAITEHVTDDRDIPVVTDVVADAARTYTNSEQFTSDFVDLAGQQHNWLFTEPAPGTDPQVMELDITPMINRTLAEANLGITVTGPVDVPVSVGSQLSAGEYREAGDSLKLTAYASLTIAVVAGFLALLIARRRGTVIMWLGVAVAGSGALAWAAASSVDHLAERGLGVGTASAEDRLIRVVIGAMADDLIRLAIYLGIAGAIVVVAGFLFRLVEGRLSNRADRDSGYDGGNYEADQYYDYGDYQAAPHPEQYPAWQPDPAGSTQPLRRPGPHTPPSGLPPVGR